MAEDQQQANQQQKLDCGKGTLPALVPGLQGAEASALHLKIKNTICKSVQSKVDNMLQDVEKFTDIEKLYLYLKLPSGPSSSSDKSDQSSMSSSRTQQIHAFNWIRSQLEEHPETSLPKQEVYDEYKSYCDNLNYHPLSAADFGKIMKNIFPSMKARRLGMRGKSKYCYSGLRKKNFVYMPSLPNLDFHKTGDGHQCEMLESSSQIPGVQEDVRLAACGLVCDWAQKVLSRHFDAVEDLARFLLNSHYVSNKSVAALTIMTATPTDAKTPQPTSAFVPTAESLQPQETTLCSPSIDAKQQLQRKIQRKQQEQKMNSPLPGESQLKRENGGTPAASTMSCGSPTVLSPQPTIGIVVAAVPSPITVQRSRQLMSPRPVGAGESRVLPVNFQVVPVKQCPKTTQNILASPAGDRSARQRYAQILPKPSVTSAITIHSPPTMLITNSPIKTVMPTSNVSSVNMIKMTTLSLALSTNTTTASLTKTILRPASTGISSSGAAEEFRHCLQMRSGSAAPILAPVAGRATATHSNLADVEMEDESICESSHALGANRLILIQEEATGQRAKEAMPRAVSVPTPRAASVPTPLTKGSLGLESTCGNQCSRTVSSVLNTVTINNGGNNNRNSQSTLHLTVSAQNRSAASNLGTNGSTLLSSEGGPDSTPYKGSLLSTKGIRKRSGLSPDSYFSPVKRAFMSQQPAGGWEDLRQGMGNTMMALPRPGAPLRPESAPAIGKVTVNSALLSPILAHSHSPVAASGFQAVPKTHRFMQRESTSTLMETCNSIDVASVSHGLHQQQQQQLQQNHLIDNTQAMSDSPDFDKHVALNDRRSSVWARGQLEGEQQRSFYAQQVERADHKRSSSTPVVEPLPMMSQASASSQTPLQTVLDYFSFNDDDVTQDSIVEELVQMEEQMKLKHLQEFEACVTSRGQQAVTHGNAMPSGESVTPYYYSANSRGTPMQTPTPTPTPTPTSEMMGGAKGLTRESPCSRIALSTPVDSALGSSRHTPIGTPHSNCSSGIPPSPVECRNPFAFTPINSSIAGFHDGSILSSSPVKPMQRPMATHPDKAKLEWINNSYNSSCGGNSNNGILPSYQDLADSHFQKPHAFAIPGQSCHSQTRHHDRHFGRLTPISPVQQQVASMAGMTKQVGFAVPAPLDNRATSASNAAFRCRSMSPAVCPRNFSGNLVNTALQNIPRTVVSPFNSPVTSEVLNILSNGQPDDSVRSMAQRSQSVPLNVMMQTEVLPMRGQQSINKNITNLLLSKMDTDDSVRGLGINNLPSNYTACMNLTQILEDAPGVPCRFNQQTFTTSGNTPTYRFQKPCNLMENAMNEQMILSVGEAPGEQHHQQGQSMLLIQNPQQQQHQQHQQLDFSTNVKELFTNNRLIPGDQFVKQVSELNTGVRFPCDIKMNTDLSSSINDLNTLDTNLLFDPNQQQGHYEGSTTDELMNDPLFQQICSETANSNGFEWLESKDQPTVGLMG